MSKMTKIELSLLLYLETRLVDYGGKVDTRRMNSEDSKIIERWVADGFVSWGRVIFQDCTPGGGSMWCQFSDKAWEAAHAERRARATRTWESRPWMTTEEKREQEHGA